jgi:ribosomal protein S19
MSEGNIRKEQYKISLRDMEINRQMIANTLKIFSGMKKMEWGEI